jgi:phenylpropionate dioxygenase-like ring-hydroxylating dioxygenase large terminal subunit
MKSSARKPGGNVPEIARGVPAGLELGLRNYWYPVLQTEEVVAAKPTGFMVFGEPLVAWRDSQGLPHILRDKCPHRGVKLSAGRVLGGDLQCAWHGLRFDGAGRCTLIPWEAEDAAVLSEISVRGYLAQELGGYIWAYIGDPEKFPPPPLADTVPEELSHPESFMWFRMPTDVWKANWLQCLEGSDGFHAVMLHSDSQAVENEEWKGGAAKRSAVPLEKRRMQVVSTSQGFRGVALDHDGKPIHHGHFLEGWKGQRWTLPCLHSIPLKPVPNADPYVSRLYQFPLDATHTQVVRFLTWRAGDEAQRAKRKKLWDDIVFQRQLEVSGEDKAIVETLGDLVESRAEEYLLFPDQDVIKIRRHVADGFIEQLEGRRTVPGKDDLMCPV